MYEILAEGLTTDIGIGDLLNVATATGFAGLAWYLIVRHGPKQTEDFRKDLTDARLAFEAELRAERTSRELIAEKFTKLLAENREVAHEQANRFMQLVTESREQNHQQRIEDRVTEREAMRAMLQEFLASMKELKHGG